MRFLIILFFISPFVCDAQDLTGLWKGVITQNEGGYAKEYQLEFQISHQNDKINGVSNAYLDKVIIEKIAFRGGFKSDSIIINEFKTGLIKNIQPEDYVPCIKNYILSYQKKSNGIESLIGRWNGNGHDPEGGTSEPCIPGLVYLTKVNSDILLNDPNYNFTDSIGQTKILIQKEIEVNNRIIQIALSDYERQDGDIVSILLNREFIAKQLPVRKQPYFLTLALETEISYNELIILAENLGRIPPNTAYIQIFDGDKIHEVYVSSDFKNSAAIKIKYKQP